MLRSAALVGAVIASLVLPAAGSAHGGGLGSGGVAADLGAAVELPYAQAEALAALPRESASGSCARTEQVEGLGDACRTDDGLFRVVLDDGSSMTTHGGDAPAAAHSAAYSDRIHLPQSEAALDAASAADIECVTDSSKRVELVYAYPSDRPNRSAALTGPMRQAIYEASAFLDAESQALDDAEGRRMRVLCAGGLPTVHVEQVGAVGADGGTFSDLVSDLVDLGYPTPLTNSASNRRFVIFYDAPSESGAAGTGHLLPDDSAASGNTNNKGARYAVEYDWATNHLPHWDVLLHEIGHNMGAVQDSAPNDTGAGHCIDGFDIMCYDDGGPDGEGMDDSICLEERFDCNNDTYFDPSPAPGSYLATHWNVGDARNAWLEGRSTAWDDGGIADVTAPTDPGSVTVTASTTTSVSLSWSASTDARTDPRYTVQADRSINGSWVPEKTQWPVGGTTVTMVGLVPAATYRFHVAAVDRAGNVSGAGTASGSTVQQQVPAPASVRLDSPGAGTISVAWDAAATALPVRHYELSLLHESEGIWRTIAAVNGTSASIGGLIAGTAYRVRVRTIPMSGSPSDWRESVSLDLSTRGTRGAGEAPLMAFSADGPSTASVTWTAEASSTWSIVITDAKTGKVFARRSGSWKGGTERFSSLIPQRSYTATLTTTTSGTTSAPATATATTLKDRLAPTTVKFSGKAKVARGKATLRWAAASDDSFVVRYELERRVGSKWKRTKLSAAARSTVITKVPRAGATVRLRAVDYGGRTGRWATVTIR